MDDMKNYFENSINNYSFDQIIKEIEKTYKSNKNIYFSFKKRLDFSDLIIKITYKRRTNLNFLNSQITFYIEIDKNFPNSIPFIKMISNVNLLIKFSLLLQLYLIVEIYYLA